jgi:hypothetical protein
MSSRIVAVFVAFFLILLSGAGWAADEHAGPVASAAALSAQDASDANDGWTAAEVDNEGSMDLPDLVQPLADPWMAAPSRVRPGPHRAAIWRAPVLDGLRRPPRRLPATA